MMGVEVLNVIQIARRKKSHWLALKLNWAIKRGNNFSCLKISESKWDPGVQQNCNTVSKRLIFLSLNILENCSEYDAKM